MQGEEPRLELLLSIDTHLREAVVPMTLPAGGGSSDLFARLAHATLAGGLEMQKSEPPRSKLRPPTCPGLCHRFSRGASPPSTSVPFAGC